MRQPKGAHIPAACSLLDGAAAQTAYTTTEGRAASSARATSRGNPTSQVAQFSSLILANADEATSSPDGVAGSDSKTKSDSFCLLAGGRPSVAAGA